MRTRFWLDDGVRRGADGLSLRFFSRPPRVDVYCQVRIVEGREKAIAIDLRTE